MVVDGRVGAEETDVVSKTAVVEGVSVSAVAGGSDWSKMQALKTMTKIKIQIRCK